MNDENERLEALAERAAENIGLFHPLEATELSQRQIGMTTQQLRVAAALIRREQPVVFVSHSMAMAKNSRDLFFRMFPELDRQAIKFVSRHQRHPMRGLGGHWRRIEDHVVAIEVAAETVRQLHQLQRAYDKQRDELARMKCSRDNARRWAEKWRARARLRHYRAKWWPLPWDDE